jgi:hypothetical protein
MPITPSRTHRLHTRIDASLMASAKHEALQRRVPVRAVVEAALSERYEPEPAKVANPLLLKELRALRREVRRVDFGTRVLAELTTLTAKNLFARLPAATADSKSAGEGFYNALISSVERVFAQDTPLLDRLAASLLTTIEAEIDALAATMEAGDVSEVVPESEPATG